MQVTAQSFQGSWVLGQPGLSHQAHRVEDRLMEGQAKSAAFLTSTCFLCEVAVGCYIVPFLSCSCNVERCTVEHQAALVMG